MVDWRTILFGLGFLLSVTVAESEESAQGAEVLFATVCATCHGPEGQGNPELKAPSIAGLPAWFVELQIEKFRQEIRGDVSDVHATQMAAIARAVPEDMIPGLARKVAFLKVQPTTSTLETGDPAVGERIYMEICAQCHRYNGQGERVFHSAPLTTLPDWYLRDALLKFRNGQRGTHHEDIEGGKMREITKWLSEESFDDLVAWIAVLAEKYPPGEARRRGPRSAPDFRE